MLEDDLTMAKHAIVKVKESAVEVKEFGLLAFYSGIRRTWSPELVTNTHGRWVWAACAWLYTKDVAEKVVNILNSKASERPVDLLVPPYVIKELKLSVYERTPNLFQHVSEHSTYHGKDAENRHAELWRSVSYERDEGNNTAAVMPSNRDGYIGCFKDHSSPRERDLAGSFDVSGKQGHIIACRTFCNSFHYFGLQSGFQCYCGNEFGLYGQISEVNCNYTCQMKREQFCGGLLTNSVYRVSPYSATFVGCYKKEVLSFLQVKMFEVKTIQQCVDSCLTLKVYLVGLQYKICYCLLNGLKVDNKTADGDLLNSYKIDDSQCNSRCEGHRGQVCGGVHKMAVYKI